MRARISGTMLVILALAVLGPAAGLAEAGSALAVHGSPQVQLQFRIVIPYMLSLRLSNNFQMEAAAWLGRGQDVTAALECAHSSFPSFNKRMILRSGPGQWAGKVEAADHAGPGCQTLYYTVAAP